MPIENQILQTVYDTSPDAIIVIDEMAFIHHSFRRLLLQLVQLFQQIKLEKRFGRTVSNE